MATPTTPTTQPPAPATPYPGRGDVNDYVYTLDPWSQDFLRGARAGTAARHYQGEVARNKFPEPPERGYRALNDLLDALEKGAKPAQALYGLAGLGKKGKTKPKAKHFDDLLDEHIAAKAAVAKEVVSGHSKASAARARQRASEPRILRGVPGIARGPLTNRGDLASAGVFLIDTVQSEYFRRVRERIQQRRNILGVGRRGAAATRPFIPSAAGATNRTGARSTRPLGPVRASGRAKPAERGAIGSIPGSSGRVDSRSSAGSKPAKSGSTPRSSTSKQQAKQVSVWEKLLSQVTGSFSTQLGGSRSTSTTRQALRSRVPASRLSSTPSTENSIPELQIGQISASSSDPGNRCKCPPKRKSSGEPRCSNPVVSKIIKDGFITIKRKIQCLPSKRK